MTTPPRGAPGTHPSQPQLIPNTKYNQQHFPPSQAYSPRHPAASSPLQQQHSYYPQGNVSSSSHDAQHMYKNQAATGTPPAGVMMMQQRQMYQPNGQRQQSIVNPGSRYFYSTQMISQRYPSPQPGPTTSPSYYQSQGGHFPYVHPQQPMGHQQPPMYSNMMHANPYSQPPPQLQPMPTVQQQQQQIHQQPTGARQRQKKIIRITHPDTKEDVTSEVLGPDSESTPPSGRTSATPPTVSDVPSEFALKVAAAIGGTVKTRLTNQRQDTQPIMMNQSPAMMQQMQDHQIVGSPNMGAPMHAGYMGMPQIPPSQSPRPPAVQATQMMMSPYAPPMQGTGAPPSHFSAPMLSSSPSHTMAAPSPMSMPQTINEPPPTAYQLPPQNQLYGTSPRTGPSPLIRPDKVHTIRPQPANIVTNEQTAIMSQQPPGPPARPTVPQFQPKVQTTQIQQPPPAVQQDPIANVSVPMVHEVSGSSVDNVALSSQPEPVVASSQPVASVLLPNKKKTEEKAAEASAVQSAKAAEASAVLSASIDESDSATAVAANLATVPVVAENVDLIPQPNDAQTTNTDSNETEPIEQVVPEDSVLVEPVPNVEADISAEQYEISKPLLPESEKLEQVPEKEDTAIRLEDESTPSLPTTSEKYIDDELLDKNNDSKNVPSSSTEVIDKSETNQISKPVVDDIKPPVTEKITPPVSVDVDTGKGEPSTPVADQAVSHDTPKLNIVPATPPSTLSEAKKEKDKTPVPSAKVAVKKSEPKTEQTQAKTVEAPAAQPEKVAPPESSKDKRVVSPDPKIAKTSKKSLTESDDIKQVKSDPVKRTALKQQSEKPVVNGLLTESSPESDSNIKKPSKSQSPTTPKTSKNLEMKSAPEAKSAEPKQSSITAKMSSASSDKPSNEKPIESEKTNGIASEKKARTIKYDEDQWSPHNPSGKKQYDSNFLLQFQYKPTSLEKPKDLPDIDIVLTHPHKKIAVPMQPMDYDFITPQYMQRRDHRPPARQRSQDHRRSGRGSMSGPGGQKIIQKVVSIDRTEVELKRSTNAWKPAKLDTSNVPTEDKEALEVERAVRSILNKLTPSTFPDLVKEVLALKIDHEKKLRRAIDLVFEKAIDEPNFCEVYAKLCRRMTALHVLPDPSPDQEQQVSPQPVEFRKLLLTKCQREFEKEKSDQEHLLEMKKKMEENTNMEIAAQLKEEYQITEMKERRRTLGNIRFIGELFKLRMLTENIMHNCIMSLFKARDGDHLESLCRLLTTIGKDLDHVKGQKRMDQYFDQIQRIITEKRTSSRVRFMLQDVYDLRLNSWTPRAIKAQGPKTITQIHQDAKDEQALEQLKIANASSPATATMKQQSGRSANRMGSRGHGVEDGWTKVQTPKPTRYDPTKMKLKPNTFDDVNKVTLGPPTRGFGGWKSGSGGSGVTKTGSGNYSPSSSMDRTPDASGRSNTPTSMVNRFSVFGQAQGEMDYQRRQAGRQSSREGTRSGSRGSMGPPTSGGRTPRRDERTSLLETARKLTSTDKTYNARQSSRESSPSMKPRASTPPQQQQLEQQQPVHKYNTDLDEEKMQTKSKSIIEEFLSILDYKEATECIAELNAPPSMMFSLVFVAHDFSLEKNYEARTNVGKLMAHLLKRGKLSSEQYVKGLLDVLDLAIDNEIDIPKVWQYYAEQMSPVFEEDSDVTLSCLIELAAPLQEVDRALIFVAEIVKAITKRMPMEAFVQQWQRSNMSWSKLSGKNDKQAIDQFLSKHRLEDLADTVGSGVSESKELQYRYEQSINRLLLQSESSNEKIFEWVDATIPREDLVKPAFIRALTISVCRNAINRESMTIFKNKMERWSIVLKKYLDTNPERELQALYGLQELMVELEQPPNLLRLFFDDLYDKDVILEQSFDNWEKSDDPNEQEGRGVAVASANPFFTWLRTAEAESDGEN